MNESYEHVLHFEGAASLRNIVLFVFRLCVVNTNTLELPLQGTSRLNLARMHITIFVAISIAFSNFHNRII